MDLITTISDLRTNFENLDQGLVQQDEYAKKLILRGRCFIVVNNADGYRFYPSRFMGYQNNTLSRHFNNATKDGKRTNPVIQRILATPLVSQLFGAEWHDYEERFIQYCMQICSENPYRIPNGRKYWHLVSQD